MRRILFTAVCLTALLQAMPLHAQQSIGLRTGITNSHYTLNRFKAGIYTKEKQPYSWENELYYENRLKCGWSLQAGIGFTSRERMYYTSLTPQNADAFIRFQTGITQVQLAAMYDGMRFLSKKSSFQLNLGLSLSPAVFLTITEEFRGGYSQSIYYKATEYGVYAGLLFQPAYRLSRHLTLNAAFRLQEIVYAGSAPYGYGEMSLNSGRHSYALGLAYRL